MAERKEKAKQEPEPEPEKANGGQHPWLDAVSKTQNHPDFPNAKYLAETVLGVEHHAIDKRRESIKTRNRVGCELTGLALSGGGIRSASFALGALQAFHDHSGIEGIDYLSTVSGGGYTGCSLMAAMHCANGEFPFTANDTVPTDFSDTPSIMHIRDFSNYLIPRGKWDIITALCIYGRGLVANALIVLPVLLLFVWFTLLNHPTVDSLSEPNVIVKILHLVPLTRSLKWPTDPLWGLPGFWLTTFLVVVDVILLGVWACPASAPMRQIGRVEEGRISGSS